MSEPTEADADAGGRVLDRWEDIRGDLDDEVFAFAGRQDVERNLATTGFPPERLHLVEGKVEETIPAQVPEQIAVLRLDTDWYESTRHELEHLWPRLSPGGILLLDDYGHWAGARKAVDEHFAGRDDAPLLTRVDYSGRVAVKR